MEIAIVLILILSLISILLALVIAIADRRYPIADPVETKPPTRMPPGFRPPAPWPAPGKRVDTKA